jgi:hypothetical protein
VVKHQFVVQPQFVVQHQFLVQHQFMVQHQFVVQHTFVVQPQFVTVGQTVNSAIYDEFLQNMRDVFGGKTPETLIQNLYHASLKCVTSHLPRTAVVFVDEPNLSHSNPPNLPKRNPCDLCLLSGLKNGLKFRSFASLKKFKIKQQQVQQPSQIAVP